MTVVMGTARQGSITTVMHLIGHSITGDTGEIYHNLLPVESTNESLSRVNIRNFTLTGDINLPQGKSPMLPVLLNAPCHCLCVWRVSPSNSR